MNPDNTQKIAAGELTAFAGKILEAVGTPPHRAQIVADALVQADLEGATSHGVMLLPMYVDRIRHGSVDPTSEAQVVVDSGSVAVVDAHHGLGQPSSDISMSIAVDKAKTHGSGVVGVRHAFHFGTARRYALQAVDAGCVGLAMSNTRPLMPAPGGAERLVGNNPMAIAFPSRSDIPLVLDLAMSEAAMGKIRFAQQTGEEIPDGWATDSSGVPTTDPAKAIEGMLLPFGGHKGFGLAFMVDLLCGVLSGGSWGSDVQPLYGDPTIPYDGSHLFIAIDPATLGADNCGDATAKATERIRNSKRAPGTNRLYAPGEPEWSRHQAANGLVTVDETVWVALLACAEQVGAPIHTQNEEKGSPNVETRDLDR